MKVLAFDTSSPYASLALCEGEVLVAETTFLAETRHSELLHLQIEALLGLVGWEFAQIERIVVGVGPGSFTGLRVGVATAQGLAFAHDCSIVGISSLDALAYGAPNGPSIVAVCKDARKKEVYVGLYRYAREDGHLEAMEPARLLRPEALVQELAAYEEPMMVLGDGGQKYEALFREGLGADFVQPQLAASHILGASRLAWLGQRADAQAVEGHEAWRVQPLYIRPSEAEMNIGPPEGGAPLQGRLRPDGSVMPEQSVDDKNDLAK